MHTCVCASAHLHVHVQWWTFGAQKRTSKCGFWYQTQVIRLGNRHFHLQYHLTDTTDSFKTPIFFVGCCCCWWWCV